MKEILVLCIGTELGGIEKSLIEFLKYISKKNYSIDLILWKKPGPLYSEIPSNINIIDGLTPGNIRDIMKLQNLLSIIKRVIWYCICKIGKKTGKPWRSFKRIKKHYDCAISYCHNGYSPYYMVDMVHADKKYMWYHHGSYEGAKQKYLIDKNYYSKLSGIVAVSESCKNMLNNLFPDIDIRVINNIVDIEEIKSKAIEKQVDIPLNCDEIIFVTVSRLSHEKGIDIAIETAKILKDRGNKFKWYFIGDGEFREEIELLINEYSLEKECILLGEKKNPYQYMCVADIYVQTSRVEAHPITIIEAMILNKMIIASDIPAIKNVVKDGEFAILTNNKPYQVAKIIEKFIQNRDLCDVYIKRLEKKPYSNKEIMNKIDSLLQNTI